MSGRITSKGGCLPLFLWLFALVWNGVIWSIVPVILRGSSDGTQRMAILGFLALFLLAGLFLIWLATRATLDAVRFRGTILDLQTNPGILGGTLAGVLHVRPAVLRLAPLSLRLTSWKRYRSSDSSDDLLWEQSSPLDTATPFPSGPGTLGLPFSVRVPYDCEPTTDGDPHYAWRLELVSPRKKSNVSFEVPVARTEASSPEQTRRALEPVRVERPPSAAATLEQTGSGVAIRFPRPSWVWKWYSMIAILTAGAFALASELLPDQMRRGMPLSFAAGIYLAIAGVALFLIAMPMLTLAMTVRQVDADRSGLVIRYALPGRSARRIGAGELRDIAAAYSNSAAKYEVNFIGADLKPVPWLILSMPKDEADWVALELRKAVWQ